MYLVYKLLAEDFINTIESIPITEVDAMSFMCSGTDCKAKKGPCKHEKMMIGGLLVVVVAAVAFFAILAILTLETVFPDIEIMYT